MTPIAIIIPDTAPTAPAISYRHAPTLRSPIPVTQPFVQYSLVESAWSQGVPVLAIGPGWSRETLDSIATLGADLICIACFPWRIPPALIAIPPYGFLNIHPSLLPNHRGPAPIFWTLWNGEASTGVTLHALDAGFDSGPIVAQQALDLSEGMSHQEVEHQLTQLGADLLISAIKDGTVLSGLRRNQAQGGSYEPWPSTDAYRISQQWSARRAYICIRGLSEIGGPFHIRLPDADFEITDVLGYDPAGVLGQPYINTGDIWVQMSPGVLHTRGILLTSTEERIA